MVLTSFQMKEAERLTNIRGLSYFDMMENAGTAAFLYIKEKYNVKGKCFVILTGGGNNGGDGYVVAKRLLFEGAKVCVLRLDNGIKTKLCFENQQSFIEIGGQTLMISLKDHKKLLDDADIIIDAVFGTGFRGKLDADTAKVFEYINTLSSIKISLDVESGVNSDTAQKDENAFKANTILSFAAIKPAYGNDDRVSVLDIGIKDEDIKKASLCNIKVTADLVKKQFKKRKIDANKGDFGRLINIAGSYNMPGAAMMSTLAALRCGSGITVLASNESTVNIVAPHIMEAIVLKLPQDEKGDYSVRAKELLIPEFKRVTACSIGCGLSLENGARDIVKFILQEAKCHLVIDADALNCISKDVSLLNSLQKSAVLTPHPLEMARLLGIDKDKVLENRRETVLDFARQYNVVTLLKGNPTLIATPWGDVYENTTGNPSLSKGGSGDVLTGMIGAFLAQGMSIEGAAFVATFIHGYCADRLVKTHSELSVLARDIIDDIPYALKELGL